MNIRFLAFFLLAFGVFAVGPAGAAELPPLSAVIQTLECPFQGSASSGAVIKDFKASFTQQSHLVSLDRTQTGSGEVAVKFVRSGAKSRPQALFRWDYQKPAVQHIISDGRTVWVYVPDNHQVFRSPIDANGVSRPDDPVTFLTGLGDLKRDFTVAYAVPARDETGNSVLTLRPRHPSPLLARLDVVVDRRAVAGDRAVFPLRSTLVVDAGGNTTRIAFDHVVVNVSLPDRLFHFTVPPGVEVLNPSLQQDQQ
jgi:outer membrane lipoprotein carrier protein